MNRRAEIAKLQVLAQLVLDHQLSGLRKAADAKAQSQAALLRLAQPPCDADGLQGAAAELAGLSYQRWADARRAEINQVLARQTHDWLEARDQAKLAFGKAEALRKLAAKDVP